MEDNVAEERGELISQLDPRLLAAVSEIVEGRIKLQISATAMTTYSVGGAVDAVITVESVNELQRLLGLLHREQQASNVFGFGSNLLVSDEGLRGWTIRLGAQFRGIEYLPKNEIELGGACSMMSVSRRLSEEGLSGLEFGAGIPGSLGGATFMNAGAHGGEIGSRIISVLGVMPDGAFRQWSGDELTWAYRHSGLPSGCVVTAVRVRLVPGDRGVISKRSADNLAYRRATQPLALPSAGSVFQNPSADRPAGLVLEQAGVKGLRVGGAVVSTLHANWIVNPDKTASASDIVALMKLCQVRVKDHSGIDLKPEVKVMGRFAR